MRISGEDIPTVINFAKWTVISTQIYVRLTQARHNLLVHASPEAILGKPNHNLAVKRALRILGKALSQQRMTLSSSFSSSFLADGKGQLAFYARCHFSQEQKRCRY